MFDTYVPAVIRTLAGYLVAWLLSLKFAGPILDALGQAHASDTDRQRLISLAVLVIGTLYYATVRLLEQRFPDLTVLLGSSKQPVAYADAGNGASPRVAGAEGGALAVDVDLNADYDAAPSTGDHAAPVVVNQHIYDPPARGASDAAQRTLRHIDPPAAGV